MLFCIYERFWAKTAGATAFVVLTVTVVGLQGADAGSPSGAGAATIHGSFAQAPWPHGHLYVLDTGSDAVDRFPIARDGLPATKPDGVLNLTDAQDPLGLAVDRSGNVFVADGGAGSVTEYAAGATGPQKPISTLNIPDAPDFLKMDGAERLYVHYGGGQGQSIGIYARGAQGNDPPISVIEPYYKPEAVVDYVITPQGALYILDWSMGASIIGYNNPLGSLSKQPNVLMSLQGGLEFDAGYSMAFDDATNQLYFQFSPQAIGHGRYMNFAARKLPYHGSPDHMFFSGQCPAQDGDSGGAVIVKQYLMVSCLFDPEVLVYRKDLFGERQPAEIVGRGTLRGPSQIAIGP